MAGSTASVTITTPSGKALSDETYAKTISGRNVDGLTITKNSTNYTVKFPMPEEDVVIYPVLEDAERITLTFSKTAAAYMGLQSGEYPVGTKQSYTVTEPASGTVLAIRYTGADGTVTYGWPADGSFTLKQDTSIDLVTTTAAAWTDEGYYDARLYEQAIATALEELTAAMDALKRSEDCLLYTSDAADE